MTGRTLDRLEQFDERSRNFSVRKTVEGKKPRSYTWRCRANLDQGREGACVGFGVAHEIIARPAEVKGITNHSARLIYKAAQKIDPWPGESYEGTSVLAGIKVAQRLGYFDSYRWAFRFKDLVLGVGYNGPAVIGVSWWTGMHTPDSDGFIHVTGSKQGGHCVLVNSVNVRLKRFTIHNSWGKSWGVNGTCYISFDDMEKLMGERGEAVFCLNRHRTAKGGKHNEGWSSM